MGGFSINQNEENPLQKVDKHPNFWIHRLDLNIISHINDTKCLGAEKKNSRNIKQVNVGDKILLVTKRNNLLEFIAYTQVEEVYQDDEILYDYYFSKTKLKLKGVKYFSTPISIKEVINQVDFLDNSKKIYNYFKLGDYKQIPKKDFKHIFRKKSLIKTLPSYLEEVSMTFKEFMLSTIKAVFSIVKYYENKKQIEIIEFLNILKKFLDDYHNINKSFDEIQEFYARHAIELGFKHLPSRDPDKFVALYLATGQKRNFAYISLE